MSTHVVHLGNPVPHRPVTEDGFTVGHEPLEDSQPSVTELALQPDVAKSLVQHAAKIERAVRDEGVEFSLRCLAGVIQRDRLPEHELACGHVLYVVRQHARSGASWVSSEHKTLEHVLHVLLDAVKAPKGTSEALTLARHEGGRWDEITEKLHGPTALKTKAGVGVIANASLGTSAQPAALNYVGLTANTEAPSASNTSLAGEITTASGGLIRKQATYAFTESTGVATLTVTFTANGSDALPVTVAKFGVFNKATSGGTLGIETKLSATVTFSAAEDPLTLVETIAIS